MKQALARLALGLVLLAGSAQARDNVLGIFFDPDAAVDEVDVEPNTTHMLYLVLMNPVNEDFDGGGTRDVNYVSGFECAVEPPAGDVLLGVQFPAQAVNLGTSSNIVAGFATGVPVDIRGAATLATLSVLTMGNNPVGYRLSPASPASHPNTMAYLDAEDPQDDIVDMGPVSGDYANPVFTFGVFKGEEVRAWGAVKSLFR